MGAVSTQLTAPPAAHTNQHINSWKHIWKKRAVTWARWLHIYLSMVSFAILFFFAATGFTLAHQDWFANQQRTFTYKGTVDRAWLGKDVAKLEIVEQLRRAHRRTAEEGEFPWDVAPSPDSLHGPGCSREHI